MLTGMDGGTSGARCGGGREVVVGDVDGGGNGLDLYELPEGCIANVLSFTGPSDTCRLSTVSSIFKSAAESDAIWERFLPADYRSILSQSSDCSSSSLSLLSSKKQLYLSLCEHPILIHDGKKSFQLEKWSGKKCYMISARDLMMVWADTPIYWRWTSDPDSRFGEVAELLNVCWFEIRGKINTCMLSPSTLYSAYLVFKTSAGIYGFEHQPVEVKVGLSGTEGCIRTVYLDPQRGRRRRSQFMRRRLGLLARGRVVGLQAPVPPPEMDGLYPKERSDGWMEIELGEFFNKDGDGGELEMSALEVKAGDWKGGIIVQGIEIRPKVGKCP